MHVRTCESAAVRWLVSLHLAQQCDSWVISNATSCQIQHNNNSKGPKISLDENVGKKDAF